MRVLLLLAAAAGLMRAGRFYADDPLAVEPPPRDASKAIRRKISDYYDFVQQSFAPPGERQPKRGKPIPAQAVNTLGEPMEGAWWVRRNYYQPMTIEELARGPGNQSPPSPGGKWKVVKAKSEGITPGFEIVDSNNRRYVMKFDPFEYPEIATGPDVLVSKFFHALGYHVPENYIVYFRRDQLELAPDVTLTDDRGRVRKMTDRDVTELLLKVPRDSAGRYRGGASLYLDGKPLGPFKYHGVRRDDPNDTARHEHRRDLRGLSVFCAWLGHDDSRAINTQDMLVERDGVRFIRHNLIDFGSTLGSASNGPNTPRSGFEYLFEWPLAARQFLTLGLWVPGWARARYPNLKAVGRFESERFDAEGWVAEYPNPAFSNRLPDDAFWAAKQVMAFRDEQIRAIVKTGLYSDARVEQYLADALIERRDKIGRAFFGRVLALDRFAVRDGRLVFDDLEVEHKFRNGRTYRYSWSRFDNTTGARAAIAGEAGARVPTGDWLVCEIRSSEDGPKTVTVYLRGGAVVGIERGW